MLREVTSHKVNGLNDALRIVVLDEPGQGNACHKYEICWGVAPDDMNQSNPTFIAFQNGPIKEFGVNGVSNEALLAIVRDRLECFQHGPFACETNQQALQHVVAAMESLHSRTRERTDRGVEGMNVV